MHGLSNNTQSLVILSWGQQLGDQPHYVQGDQMGEGVCLPAGPLLTATGRLGSHFYRFRMQGYLGTDLLSVTHKNKDSLVRFPTDLAIISSKTREFLVRFPTD